VSEACFQHTVLQFAGSTTFVQYAPQHVYSAFAVELPRVAIPRVTVREGTHPKGSEWAYAAADRTRTIWHSLFLPLSFRGGSAVGAGATQSRGAGCATSPCVADRSRPT
jgi:hypothetical protein